MPHSSEASDSSLTNCGGSTPVAPCTGPTKVSTCSCAAHYRAVCLGRRRSSWTGAPSGARGRCGRCGRCGPVPPGSVRGEPLGPKGQAYTGQATFEVSRSKRDIHAPPVPPPGVVRSARLVGRDHRPETRAVGLRGLFFAGEAVNPSPCGAPLSVDRGGCGELQDPFRHRLGRRRACRASIEARKFAGNDQRRAGAPSGRLLDRVCAR
jgi:hypothetical protein